MHQTTNLFMEGTILCDMQRSENTETKQERMNSKQKQDNLEKGRISSKGVSWPGP